MNLRPSKAIDPKPGEGAFMITKVDPNRNVEFFQPWHFATEKDAEEFGRSLLADNVKFSWTPYTRIAIYHEEFVRFIDLEIEGAKP